MRWLLGFFLSLIVACGGGHRTYYPKTSGRNSHKAPAEVPKPAKPVLKSSGNLKFDLLRPFFVRYIQSRGPIVNPFKSNLAQFAPKVSIVVEEEKKPVEKAQPKSPLQYHPLSSYQLKAVISGTAIPKALVVDAKGNSYVIKVGTPIGSEGGKVTAITEEGIVVDIPGKQPVVMKIMETTSEMARIIQNMNEF